MKPSRISLLGLGLGLAFSFFHVDYQPGSGLLEGLTLVKGAEAVVGRPATPVSAAGVARRTTRRVIRRTTIYVVSLPPSCTTVIVEGTHLHLCGGTYYQPYGTQYVVVHVD